MIEKLKFNSLTFNLRKQVLFGVDSTELYFVKVQVVKNPNKRNDIAQEYKIMKHLNSMECVTCPIAFEYGKASGSFVYDLCEQKGVLDSMPTTDYFEYILQQFVPSKNGYNLSDILMSVIEQQSLGIYHGDIKPDNVRFHNNICYLIDYDQAMWLDKPTQNYDVNDFVNFCSNHYSKKYCSGDPQNFLSRIKTKAEVSPLLVAGALDLGKTTIFKSQRTTNSPSGLYQNILEKKIIANGTRLLDKRIELLKDIKFNGCEKVLDVGCNFGMLSCYLYDRGCNVTGIDNDADVIRAAKIVSNIIGKKVNYQCLDLDDAQEIEAYDTIFLFSVLHHTKNVELNAMKIARSCKRIIFEVKPHETGKQFIDGRWRGVNEWNFKDVDSLVEYLEKIFYGFKLTKVLGVSDKNRYMLEFKKETEK